VDKLVLILGNQLFPSKLLKKYREIPIFMAESWDLCTYQKHHKLKIVLFLSAMRAYRDQLVDSDFDVNYQELKSKNKDKTFEDLLTKALKSKKELISFEIEDKFFETRIRKLTTKLGVKWTVLQSPMFISTRSEFTDIVGNKKPFMKTFYEEKRRRHKILIDKDGSPVGGKWSFDADNRKKMPKDVNPDLPPPFDKNPHIKNVEKLVENNFNSHPGLIGEYWFPTTRKGYLKALNHFLTHNLENFGKYQDAISDKTPYLFHSLISPGINIGLITPNEVVEKATKHYQKNKKTIPLNSIEGFIRQVIGWREFVRGIYQVYSEKQESSNFWNHHRKMKDVWYTGETGVPPVDSAIKKAIKYGYNHHIERLMVLSSIMLLCEIDPKEVHDWFMEMYIDTSDWVMGPNVYGMGQFSDGGIFATKPYICGSNYLIKMSDHKKGEWCDAVDGLYWNFIDQKREFFSKNPRMKMMVSSFDKMDGDKKKRIFKAAKEFKNEVTR
jgi:deoxyribodipyrimidine photolyase-related protein